jgi:MFS family permease
MQGAYRDVLGVRPARALIGAAAASEIGNWLYNAALLAYVFSVTHSAGWVAAASVGRLLPYVLFSSLGGRIADRYPKRAVLLVGDGLQLILMLALAAAVGAHGPVVVVIALAALATTAGSAERPAVLAFLPRLVGETRLGAANALVHTVQDVGIMVGPAIGALILAIGPPWVAFLANGVTFAIAGALIWSLPSQITRVAKHVSDAAELPSGIEAIRRTPFAVWVIAVVAMVEFTYGAQTVQLVVYAKHSLGLGSGGYGILLTAVGVGGLLSALLNARLVTRRRVSLILTVSGALACLTQVAYASTQVLAIALVVTVIGNAGLVSCEVVGETTLARIGPREALGRLFGTFDAASVAAMLAGALLAPVVISATSLDGSFLILGLGSLLITAVSGLRTLGLDALSREHVDALASRVEVLEGLEVTIGLPRLALEQLASSAQLRSLQPGVDVVVQGDPADAFYAIVEGQVVVNRDGRAVVHLGPGDGFGERGLLDNAPRNATVTTEVPTTVLRIEGDTLLETLQAEPGWRSALDLVSFAPGVAVPPDDGGAVEEP